MIKISVITPSIRPSALPIVLSSLKKQTFTDFEWLIGSKFVPFADNTMAIESQKHRSKEQGYAMISHTPSTKWIEDDFTGGYWTLNRIYNKLIKSARGELIISLQDSIYIPPTGLQQFWDAHIAKPEAIISGVGDQYEALDDFGRPFIKIWADPRKRMDQGSFYEITFPDVEWNWCAIPRKTLFEVGGFDEGLDFLGFGMDGYQVSERLNDLGKRFFIDQGNESFTLRHDRSVHGGEDNWNKNNNLSNGQYEKRRAELQTEGKWPVLEFLRED